MERPFLCEITQSVSTIPAAMLRLKNVTTDALHPTVRIGSSRSNASVDGGRHHRREDLFSGRRTPSTPPSRHFQKVICRSIFRYGPVEIGRTKSSHSAYILRHRSQR